MVMENMETGNNMENNMGNNSEIPNNNIPNNNTPNNIPYYVGVSSMRTNNNTTNNNANNKANNVPYYTGVSSVKTNKNSTANNEINNNKPNNKKTNSKTLNNIKANLLLIIGTILIFIGGCVFVTNAWGYLNDIEKEVCLFVAMAALFAGKYVVGEKYKLEKTANALYYLGTATAGFLTYIIARSNHMDDFWSRVTISLGTAIVLMAAKFVLEKKKSDLIVGYILLVAFSIGTCAITHGNFNIMFTIWAIVLMMINIFSTNCEKIGFDYLKKTLTLIQKIQLIVVAFGIVHFMGYILPNNAFAEVVLGVLDIIGGVMFVFNIELVAHASFMVVPFMVLSIWTATVVDMKSEKINPMRLLNSASICLFIYTFMFDCNRYLELSDTLVLAVAFLIVVALQFVLDRKELRVFVVLLAVLNSYGQLFNADLKVENIVPYALISAVGMIVFYFKENDNRYISAALNLLGLQGMILVIALRPETSSLLEYLFGVVPVVVLTIVMSILLFTTIFINNVASKKIIYTICVVCGLLLMNKLTGYIIPIPEYLVIEWFVVGIVIAIVVMKQIWYDENGAMDIMQNIAVMISLFVLLVHNVSEEQHLVCAVVFAVSYSACILYGIISSKKLYWISGLGCMVVHTVNITASFWSSIPWWCYLMLVGIAFVAIAVFLEKREKNTENTDGTQTSNMEADDENKNAIDEKGINAVPKKVEENSEKTNIVEAIVLETTNSEE